MTHTDQGILSLSAQRHSYTVVFICLNTTTILCLNSFKVPDYASADGSETDLLASFSPIETIETKMNFLPPQYIEFGRLAKLKTLSDLKEYAEARVKNGTKRFCPNPRFCSDGILMILPGDAEHQTDFNLENAPDISHLTCNEAIDFSLGFDFKKFPVHFFFRNNPKIQ